MDRYYIRPNSDQANWSHYHVVDRQDGAYDRETGARYVAQCPDPEMAQRIADLLNEDAAKKRFDAAVRSYTEANHA